MAKKEHSPNFEKVRRHYERGLWSAANVDLAVKCGWITASERDEIIEG